MKHLIIIMGVSGAGKSTLAKSLSEALDIPFLEGDDFHPTENIEKMAGGTPLTNDDRIAWIEAMGGAASEEKAAHIILSCSALNEFVRDSLARHTDRHIHWVYVKVSREELLRRLRTRDNHFMKDELLDSQLAAMEPPDNAIVINGNPSLSTCLDEAMGKLKTLF